MTEKELLYVEDVLGHEQYFTTQCSEAAGQLQDPQLKSMAEELQRQHQAIFNGFYHLL